MKVFLLFLPKKNYYKTDIRDTTLEGLKMWYSLDHELYELLSVSIPVFALKIAEIIVFTTCSPLSYLHFMDTGCLWISLIQRVNNINWPVFVMETRCFYCEGGTEFLHIWLGCVRGLTIKFAILMLQGLFIMNLYKLDKQSTKFTIWKYWKGCVKKLDGNDPSFLPTTHGSCITTMHLLTWHCLWGRF